MIVLGLYSLFAKLRSDDLVANNSRILGVRIIQKEYGEICEAIKMQIDKICSSTMGIEFLKLQYFLNALHE